MLRSMIITPGWTLSRVSLYCNAVSTRKRTSNKIRAKKKSLSSVRFYGVSLAGGKSEKTSVVALDFYTQHDKLFLGRIDDHIGSDGEVSGDATLLETLNAPDQEVQSVAFDAPLTIPLCFSCKIKCPGAEMCSEPQIVWMWKHYRKRKRRKKSTRLFTPYTERSVEMYVNTELEEPFLIPSALGANSAPLAARAQYLLKRLKPPAMEVAPRLSLWRIGSELKIPRSSLRNHRHSVDGMKSRDLILRAIVEAQILFIYQQDINKMIESPQAFDAFFCALTAFYHFKGLCEPRPKDFPRKEGWIQFPAK